MSQQPAMSKQAAVAAATREGYPADLVNDLWEIQAEKTTLTVLVQTGELTEAEYRRKSEILDQLALHVPAEVLETVEDFEDDIFRVKSQTLEYQEQQRMKAQAQEDANALMQLQEARAPISSSGLTPTVQLTMMKNKQRELDRNLVRRNKADGMTAAPDEV